MIELRRIAMSPWDYTLYESSDGFFVLKVMFSEGEYKIDIERFFRIDHLNLDDRSEVALKSRAEQIRSRYPDVSLTEFKKAELRIVK